MDIFRTSHYFNIPINQECADAVAAAIHQANGAARSGLLSPGQLRDGLLMAVSLCSHDPSMLYGRSWFVRAPVVLPPGRGRLRGRPDVQAKVHFTMAECRVSDGAFVLLYAGRAFHRANRVPEVSYVEDSLRGVRPLRFVPLA